MPVIYSNNASTSLSAGINNSTTTIPIASNSGFPSISSGEYFFATIANTANTKIEVVKVTSGTTSLTVTRGQGGTSAQAFDSGDNFQLRVTADTLLAATQTDVKVTSGTVSADTLIAKGDGSSADGQIQLNCSQNSHGIKLKSPPHSAGASYTLTFPNDDGTNGQKLTTNGSGVLTWTTVDTTIANDAIDSQHYADGSIDTQHIGNDQVTADKLANSINTAIAANTSKNTNATHSGDVTGSGALTIAADAVTYAKMQNVSATDRILGRDSSGAGIVEEITPANLRTMINVEDGATADQTAAQIKTALEDGIDSVHYVDGSIDHVHLAGDIIDGDNIADNVIDSEHINAGAVDLEHMASQSVDEDNLYISNGGSNGQFLSKQTGNNGGLTWATVSSEDFIPNGSVMCFFQSAAPSGWTKVTSQNNKVLRVVSGNGGGTGGTWATSSGVTTNEVGAHTHTSAAHTHAGGSLAAGAHTLSTAEMPSHTHSFTVGQTAAPHSAKMRAPVAYWDNNASTFTVGATGGGGTHAHSLSGTSASTTPGATGSANAHSHTISAPQYIDVIICSKDA